MKGFRKNSYVIFSTLMLLLLLLCVAETEEAPASPYFQLRDDSGLQKITVFDAGDGNCYVFLPSYADLGELQVILPPDQEYCLDGIPLYDKMSCGSFELEKPYIWATDGTCLGNLWFFRSRNVATMYLETASGEMTQIHNDKDYEEYASMTLYSSDGTIDHYDIGTRLKGRGNATWDCDKRPYVLTLSADESLLGMNSGKKWILLANSYDETNLNNMLVYDLAAHTDFPWSPECRFVDLYLNGEYSGLYLLTEKIEIQENRLDLDETAGDFLCTVEIWERKDLLQSPFESSMGRIVGVCYPEFLPKEDLEYISYLVYLMESDLSSGMDLRSSEILDLDSWVRRYLIDEISGNIDSDLTSSYFYFTDGKFYAGPIWDYDMAFGNNLRNQEPCALLAKNTMKASYFPSPYYSTLYANGSFYNRMVEIYSREFAPALKNLISGELDIWIAQIREASRMNSIRWRSMFDEWSRDYDFVDTPEDLKDYFIRRVQFLDGVWLENRDVCTVQFEPTPDSPYWNISVDRGAILEASFVDLENTVWIDAQTGIPVDFQEPVMQDLIVVPEVSPEGSGTAPEA